MSSTGWCGRRRRSWIEAGAREADVVEIGCIGLCVEEPLVDVQMPGRPRLSLSRVTEKKVGPPLDAIFDGQPLPVEPLGQFRQPGTTRRSGVTPLDDHPYFAAQTPWVLANCGILDPASLDEYLGRERAGGRQHLYRHAEGVGGSRAASSTGPDPSARLAGTHGDSVR